MTRFIAFRKWCYWDAKPGNASSVLVKFLSLGIILSNLSLKMTSKQSQPYFLLKGWLLRPRVTELLWAFPTYRRRFLLSYIEANVSAWSNLFANTPSRHWHHPRHWPICEHSSSPSSFINGQLRLFFRNHLGPERSYVRDNRFEVILRLWSVDSDTINCNNIHWFNGRTAPKISSGIIVLCISRACRNSGDWAHSGGLKVRTRSSSSESEYSLLILGSSMSSLGTDGTACLTGFGASIWTLTRAAVWDWTSIEGSGWLELP